MICKCVGGRGAQSIVDLHFCRCCTKNMCNPMIIAPRTPQPPSSSANTHSDLAVTVNFNAEFTQMVGNRTIEYLSRDLIPEYCQGLVSSVVHASTHFCVKSLHGHLNSSRPPLLLCMHAEEIIDTFSMSNIYMELCLPKAIT